MKRTITQEDLIRYIYQETDPLESELIRNAIENDWHLKFIYSELTFAKAQLQNYSCNPSQSSIDLIMNYSSGKPVGKYV